MAVTMTASGAAPIVAAALQNRRQLGLEQLLDEPANAATNRRLQRIKPILAQKWPRCGRCDSLFHGVISWRLAGRLLGCFPISRLRRLQFLPTLRHDPDGSGNYLYRIDPRSYAISRVGPYSGILGPYAVDSTSRFVVNDVMKLWGMQVADLKTARIITAILPHHPAGDARLMHGIGWTPDQSEVWQSSV